jgi:hypothetical protein
VRQRSALLDELPSLGRQPKLYSIITGPGNVDGQFTSAAVANGPVKCGTMHYAA